MSNLMNWTHLKEISFITRVKRGHFFSPGNEFSEFLSDHRREGIWCAEFSFFFQPTKILIFLLPAALIGFHWKIIQKINRIFFWRLSSLVLSEFIFRRNKKIQWKFEFIQMGWLKRVIWMLELIAPLIRPEFIAVKFNLKRKSILKLKKFEWEFENVADGNICLPFRHLKNPAPLLLCAPTDNDRWSVDPLRTHPSVWITISFF